MLLFSKNAFHGGAMRCLFKYTSIGEVAVSEGQEGRGEQAGENGVEGGEKRRRREEEEERGGGCRSRGGGEEERRK